MNAKTRKQMGQILGKLEDMKSQLEEMQSEEKHKFNHLPCELQMAEMG